MVAQWLQSARASARPRPGAPTAFDLSSPALREGGDSTGAASGAAAQEDRPPVPASRQRLVKEVLARVESMAPPQWDEWPSRITISRRTRRGQTFPPGN